MRGWRDVLKSPRFLALILVLKVGLILGILSLRNSHDPAKDVGPFFASLIASPNTASLPSIPSGAVKVKSSSIAAFPAPPRLEARPRRLDLRPSRPFAPRSFPPRKFVPTEPPPPPIRILDWTGFYGADVGVAFKDLINVCPEAPRCEYTADRNLLNSSQAVMFHLRDMKEDWAELPAFRTRYQVYVLFSFEPPPLTYVDLSQPQAQDFFNWTMTYREDSNIWVPHGFFTNDTEGGEDRHKEWLGKVKKKDKLIAWFASNCVTNSEREVYVTELQKHVDVDVFGSCGPNVCPKRGNGSDCEGKILSRYKFYLAFENSVCVDYVTEKFFWYLLKYQVLPVVLKRSLLVGVAPPGAFLAADDFHSPKELAAEITRLDKDPAAFAAHFSWLRSQRLEAGFESPVWHFCQLCRKLDNQPTPPKEFRRILHDPNGWWEDGSMCWAGYAASLLRPRSRAPSTSLQSQPATPALALPVNFHNAK